MRLALDTNTYTAFLSGDEAVRNHLIHATDILLPAIVLGELYYGFYKGDKLKENLAYLARFMRDKRVTIGMVNESVARMYGQLHADLHKIGRPIPSNDIWIAALCLELDYQLVTYDSDFAHVAGLNMLGLGKV